MANRFSKKTLQAELQIHMDGIQKIYGFDPDRGTVQLKAIAQEYSKDTGFSFERCLEEVSLAYGRYMSIMSLATEFDFYILETPAGYKAKQFWYEGRLFERLVKA